MSSLLISNWCPICHVYIYPGINPPPSHLRHSKGSAAVGVYCSTCNQTFYDNMKLPDNHPHLRHTLRDKQTIKQDSLAAQLNAENGPQPIKIINKGNYVKTAGILPNEDVVVHEKMAFELAKRRERNKNKK